MSIQEEPGRYVAVRGKVDASSAGENRFVLATETIYACAAEPARWPAALQAIAESLDCAGAIIFWKQGDGRFGTIVSPALESSHDEYHQKG